MSASAVRGGQVYVEIGANPSKLLNALRIVNTQVGNLGSSVAGIGVKMAAAGGAIAAPIEGMAYAVASQNVEVLNAQKSLVDLGREVGNAVAPAFVGMAKVVSGAAQAVSRFIRENPKLVQQLLAAGYALTGVGVGLVVFGTTLAKVTNVVGPAATAISTLWKVSLSLLGSLVTIATSGPVLALAAVLGGVALAAHTAGVDLTALGSKVGTSFQGPIGEAKRLFSDLSATASTTVEGIYNSIADGDIGAAVDIMWAGVNAAWARGEQAIMGALDPWIEMVQNVFADMASGVVNAWDGMWTNLATSEWGGQFLGAMDNVMNGVMFVWDSLIGDMQRAWAEFSAWWSGDVSNLEKEIARINNANAANAAQRGKDRPGFAGRTGLSEEQKAQMQRDSQSRQAQRLIDADAARADRAKATAQNIVDRSKAVADANYALKQKVGQTQAPPSVSPGSAGDVKTSVVGTFSAFGIDQMGGGNVQKQQLDALLKIQAGIDQANRVGGIIA